MQHQRDTEHVNVTQVEARADRRRASTTESGALPSSQASLFEFASSGKPAVLSKQTPSQKQATSEREKPEDLCFVLVKERRRAEEREDIGKTRSCRRWHRRHLHRRCRHRTQRRRWSSRKEWWNTKLCYRPRHLHRRPASRRRAGQREEHRED